MMNQKVSIVLVNHKGYEDTIECLESLLKLQYDNYRIIIVDNSTDNDSIDHILLWAKGELAFYYSDYIELVTPPERKPIAIKCIVESDLPKIICEDRILIIKAIENKGFAAANNVALKYLLDIDDSNYFWLLNNDTIVAKDALSSLINFAESLKNKTGIIGSKLYKYHYPGVLQGVGGLYNKWFGRVKELGANERDNGQWDNTHFHFDYVIGASMLVRRGFLIDVGLMDPDYFLYYEELDWAIRGKKKAWGIGFCSASKVYHKMGASTKDSKQVVSALADFYSARNRIIVALRYFPYTIVSLYPSFTLYILNRVKKGMLSRVYRLIGILFNPSKHFYPKTSSK